MKLLANSAQFHNDDHEQAMARNRIRSFAQAWDGPELPDPADVPAGFVVIPIEQLPLEMRQRVGCCGELYRIAYEQARAAVDAAHFGLDEFAP